VPVLRTLGLASGGVGSSLAFALVRAAGCEVEGVHFDHGFVRDSRRDAVRRIEAFPIEVHDVSREFFRDVVARPRYGYGTAMNPCIDCRIYMLRKAAEIARERGIEIVFTGEVLGRSVMRERRESLRRIEEESGLQGRLLRPLSARLLEPTAAERDGRIERSSLAAIHGRSRRGQADLAARLDVASPVGAAGPCCLLADRAMAARVRDLLAHADPGSVSSDAIERLRLGRHVRISHGLKAVVARNEAESRLIVERHSSLPWCQVSDGRGPVVLLEGTPDERGLSLAAALAVRTGAHRRDSSAEVIARGPGSRERVLVADPGAAAHLEAI
jgi:tRNA-uridine 2-sulfurtransferase